MYRAWDLEAKRHVVLKVARGLARDIQLRLAYEAELLSSLESPHIVPLLAAGREADGYFLALPELGPTLRERIQAGPLTVPEALTVGIGMMRALEAVHALGLRHRDIKPENVLLEQSLSRALVIDFGFAMEPAPAGSLAYMAPERLGLLDYPVDERADLYEAGLVLYEAIAGKAPYEAPSLSELLRARLAADPPGLRGRRSDVPAALESIVFRLLEVEPSKRYQQAQAVARDLEEVLAGRVPVVGATDSRHRLAVPVLVGRESELTALMDALDEAERGQVQVVRLTGPSGGGKSRLLEEFARRAQSAGARVLSGRARTRSPLLPFVQLDSVFRGVVTELSASDELRETLRPWGEVLAIALEPLRAVYPVSSGPLDDSLQIARAARQLLTSLPGPTCLLLDDCQWSDTMVFDVVEECLERAAPLLIVLAFRDEVAESHRLWGYGQTRILRLATLSKSQTRELLFSMAGPLPEQVVEWAWSASQGDPFVAISSLQGLLETRMLCYEEGRWVLSEDPELKGSLSHRAGLMLARRLDRLSLQTRAVLEAGALIGRQFVVSLISPITGLAPERVVPCLEEARRRHLLWRSDTEMVYVFSHDRIRESLLDQLPSELSSELHLRLARHLQAMDGHSVFDLAYHLHRSGRLEEAYPYARQAAEQAGERRAMELAASYFQMALQGAASAPPAVRFEISLGLGEALASLGRYGEAEGIYLELRDVAQGRCSGRTWSPG